ncbi:D-2-hydroxyacid dehydrogenase [Ornithinibacillus halophilus]|uniref:Phosphoglycerate dehydrogenase n=1 Tax=Ornithinibacillus halophilus TaxID=930117 RepID=A0A1M5KKQ9_9BACI|nr:D-2-hydroxyacid dehydrogenase [Ornithinibacillus halophilus]SHG53424.1 Phosphoglycerate dehydrogenase [Ornithinibacillus halophilus]
MAILFSANVSSKHRDELIKNYPNKTFIFCKDMNEAKEYLADAEILVTYGEDLNAQLIGKAIRLKWIMVMSAGMDLMPFKEIERRGIMVTNSRGIHKIPMAEYAISMLLQVSRNAKQLIENEHANKWDRSVRMHEMNGNTMLVLGTGAIGQETARLAKAFQLNTIGISRSGKSVEFFDEVYETNQLETVLPKADYIVSVLPSTVETRYLLKDEHFEQMKDTAIFLNMGRGDLVKSETVIKAVEENKIAHAVLDVFEQEPLPSDHPLWETEGVTVTPHISGISPNYNTRALEIFTDNLDKWMAGKKDYINLIDVTRGY